MGSTWALMMHAIAMTKPTVPIASRAEGTATVQAHQQSHRPLDDIIMDKSTGHIKGPAWTLHLERMLLDLNQRDSSLSTVFKTAALSLTPPSIRVAATSAAHQSRGDWI